MADVAVEYFSDISNPFSGNRGTDGGYGGKIFYELSNSLSGTERVAKRSDGRVS